MTKITRFNFVAASVVALAVVAGWAIFTTIQDAAVEDEPKVRVIPGGNEPGEPSVDFEHGKPMPMPSIDKGSRSDSLPTDYKSSNSTTSGSSGTGEKAPKVLVPQQQ